MAVVNNQWIAKGALLRYSEKWELKNEYNSKESWEVKIKHWINRNKQTSNCNNSYKKCKIKSIKEVTIKRVKRKKESFNSLEKGLKNKIKKNKN